MALDGATQKWGVKTMRVELRDISAKSSIFISLDSLELNSSILKLSFNSRNSEFSRLSTFIHILERFRGNFTLCEAVFVSFKYIFGTIFFIKRLFVGFVKLLFFS